MTTIGLISPGAMGAAVGAAALGNCDRVLWAGEERSRATHQRAKEAGLTDCGNVDRMTQEAEIILSICPPHDAGTVAQQVADRRFKGLFVECNAVSPAKTLDLASRFDRFLDGGIVGGPPRLADARTCLYLSGDEANLVADLFTGSPLNTHVISDEPGAASAMKMVFAAYTKGSTALLTAILGVAEHYDVRDTLEARWGDAFTQQTHRRLLGNSAKAWRFTGEMREIANTFAGAGLPDGFHMAAAEVFERLAKFKDSNAESIDLLLSALNKQN